MNRCSTSPRARQRVALITRPDYASRRARFCHCHVHASGLVNEPVDRARVGGSRFLQVDPIEGGLDTNDYAYVKDPVNEFDLNGEGFCAAGHNPKKKGQKHGGCRGGRQARAAGGAAKDAAGWVRSRVQGWGRAFSLAGGALLWTYRRVLMPAARAVAWSILNGFKVGLRRLVPPIPLCPVATCVPQRRNDVA